MNTIHVLARGLIGGVAVCLILTTGQACRQKRGAGLPPELEQRCVVLETRTAADQSGTWSAWLAAFLPEATRATPGTLPDALSLCRENDWVFIAPAALIDDVSRPLLSDYLSQGGRLLVVGRATTTAPVHETTLNKAIGGDAPHYSATSVAMRVVSGRLAVDVSPREFQSPFPPPRGAGGERAGPSRWIPVVEALNAEGGVMGWPAAAMVTRNPQAPPSICGRVQFDIQRHDGESLVPLFSAMVAEMTREVYLHRYGLARYSARSQTPLQVSAQVLDHRLRDASPLRLVVEWINASGQEIRRHVSAPLDAATALFQLNIGLAPEPSGPSEVFTLRYSIRDRNDQRTLDETEQKFKVFAAATRPPDTEPITVAKGELMQGRRPVFMMGINYWPRLQGVSMSTDQNRHWLDPERFDPDMVAADLDALVTVGIQTIALEYIDLAQAPQLLFVLDEARRRSMWVNLFVPALYPFDLRLDAALALLEAIELAAWPEVFAIEMARGLAVKSRSERRHFDEAWSDWVDEHFNSPGEAEEKLGIALWRERGRLVGPPDLQLRRGPHEDRALGLYYTFLRDYAGRRMAHIRQALRARGYATLLTCRTAYAWPGKMPPGIIDYLDISTGSLHLDFLSPEAWAIHPLHMMHGDGPLMAAYLRGVSAGKPVVWASYGQDVGSVPDAVGLQRQKEVYKHFLDLFLDQGASGALAWWFPPGATELDQHDWGVVQPPGDWRPVEDVFRAVRLRLRQSRPSALTPVRQKAPLMQSARQWRDQQHARTGLFAPMESRVTITEWTMPGVGLNSSAILDPATAPAWTEIDGLHMLNAEWGPMTIEGNVRVRIPGENVRTYVGRPLQMEILNSGTIRWVSAPNRKSGSVWLRISQPGSADEWIGVDPLDRGSRQAIRWQPRDVGLWELQLYLVGYGKFGERLRVEVTTPPRLF
jgi:hypothetical protein